MRVAASLLRLDVSRNGAHLVWRQILNDAVHHGRRTDERLNVVQLLDHILGVLACKTGEVARPRCVRSVACHTRWDTAVGEALVEQLLALGNERRIVAVASGGRLVGIVGSDAAGDRLVGIAGDRSHDFEN